jgi:hypothetical protein
VHPCTDFLGNVRWRGGLVKKEEIANILRQVNIDKLKNDGPTTIFLNCGKKNRSFMITSDKEFIVVTIGKFIFKKRYRFKKSEL